MVGVIAALVVLALLIGWSYMTTNGQGSMLVEEGVWTVQLTDVKGMPIGNGTAEAFMGGEPVGPIWYFDNYDTVGTVSSDDQGRFVFVRKHSIRLPMPDSWELLWVWDMGHTPKERQIRFAASGHSPRIVVLEMLTKTATATVTLDAK